MTPELPKPETSATRALEETIHRHPFVAGLKPEHLQVLADNAMMMRYEPGEIIFREGKQYEEEGCLSFPEIREKVVRASKVTIRAQDERGKWFEMDGEELLSRAFQHEIDHLDGMLFIFRMSALKRDLALRKIRKMQREGSW